jgi:hypothetical protein
LPEDVTPQVIQYGGLRIEIQKDRISALPGSPDLTKAIKSSSAVGTVRTFLVVVAALWAGIEVIGLFESKELDPLFALGFALLFGLPSFAWGYFQGDNYLCCSADALEVIHVARGRETIQRYSKAEVKRVRFGEVSLSKNGSINGLLLNANGKKVKLLEGLDSPEAEKILRGIDRLGFDVEHDVGMPMMVEMALERRRFSLLK